MNYPQFKEIFKAGLLIQLDKEKKIYVLLGDGVIWQLQNIANPFDKVFDLPAHTNEILDYLGKLAFSIFNTATGEVEPIVISSDYKIKIGTKTLFTINVTDDKDPLVEAVKHLKENAVIEKV